MKKSNRVFGRKVRALAIGESHWRAHLGPPPLVLKRLKPPGRRWRVLWRRWFWVALAVLRPAQLVRHVAPDHRPLERHEWERQDLPPQIR